MRAYGKIVASLTRRRMQRTRTRACNCITVQRWTQQLLLFKLTIRVYYTISIPCSCSFPSIGFLPQKLQLEHQMSSFRVVVGWCIVSHHPVRWTTTAIHLRSRSNISRNKRIESRVECRLSMPSCYGTVLIEELFQGRAWNTYEAKGRHWLRRKDCDWWVCVDSKFSFDIMTFE